MQDLSELVALMDRAKDAAGSDYKVAQALGITTQKISDMRHGRKTATPEDCALLAAVAGVDPVEEMTRAMLRKHEGSKKGELLLKALGKASLATGAAIASAGAHASVISGVVHRLLDTMYIVCFQQQTLRARFTRSCIC